MRIKLVRCFVVEVFKTFDHENNGLMNTSELNEALQLLCIDLTEEEKQDPRYIIDGKY